MLRMAVYSDSEGSGNGPNDAQNKLVPKEMIGWAENHCGI